MSSHRGARQVWGSTCPQMTHLFFLLSPSVLYPNLAELENYMGLSLSSQEVQQSLLQIPEGDSVCIWLLPAVGAEPPNPPSFLVLPFQQTFFLSVLRPPLSPALWWLCFLMAPFILRLPEKHCRLSWFQIFPQALGLGNQALLFDRGPELDEKGGC